MKTILRNKILKKINYLTYDEVQSHSSKVRELILLFLENENFKNIGIYNSFKNEIIIENIKFNSNVNIYAPAYNSNENLYNFKKIDKNSKNIIGNFNILEPTGKIINTNYIDIILVPGIAFDHTGNRLGRGKGFYDKLLENYQGIKIGICHNIQLINKVPKEPNDISMDFICTENSLFKT
tara:strand:+ start:2248 stop:2787 length:540 start_codon:yes stop_codon:yes gene_type:complete